MDEIGKKIAVDVTEVASPCPRPLYYRLKNISIKTPKDTQMLLSLGKGNHDIYTVAYASVPLIRAEGLTSWAEIYDALWDYASAVFPSLETNTFFAKFTEELLQQATFDVKDAITFLPVSWPTHFPDKYKEHVDVEMGGGTTVRVRGVPDMIRVYHHTREASVEEFKPNAKLEKLTPQQRESYVLQLLGYDLITRQKENITAISDKAIPEMARYSEMKDVRLLRPELGKPCLRTLGGIETIDALTLTKAWEEKWNPRIATVAKIARKVAGDKSEELDPISDLYRPPATAYCKLIKCKYRELSIDGTPCMWLKGGPKGSW